MLQLLCRRTLTNCVAHRRITVLGIETSCDDTSVSIVNEKKEVLAAVTYTDRIIQVQKGGISPSIAAEQHRNHLPRVLNECLASGNLKIDDVDAIAVTVTPGLVIALKEGIKTAITLAREYKKPLIPVHHMRAHALAAFLVSSELQFPFMAVLISGGHSMFVLAESADKFKLLGTSESGSPGECLDKVARELAISNISEFEGIHPGAAMEILSSRASPEGHLRYSVPGPIVNAANMNFSQLKSSWLNMVRKCISLPDFSVEDFSASVQYQVTRHICSRFHAALDGLRCREEFSEVRHIVVGGGVASNKYIVNGISKVAEVYGLKTIIIPRRLCTDNAEMIALTGLLKYQTRSDDICWWPDIPDSIYAHARSPIGDDVRSWIPSRPLRTISGPSLHGSCPVKLHCKDDFRKV